MEETRFSSPRSRSKSTEPWLWVMEYLSIFPQISTSLLHDVIEAAPEMPDEDGKTTMEMVALRCLEELYTRDDDPATHSPSRVTPATPFPDPSLTCDDALQAIIQSKRLEELHEGGACILGWDIRPFIRRKRASMPKCTLQLLRDGTLGNNCNLSSSRSDGKGGDASHDVVTEGNTVHVTLENEDSADRNYLGVGTPPLSRRRMSSLVADENVDYGGQKSSLPRSDDEDNGSPTALVTEGNDALRSSGNGNEIELNNLDCGNTLTTKRARGPSVDREQGIADVIDDFHSKVKRLKPSLSRMNPPLQHVSLPHNAEKCVDEVSERMAADAGDKLEDPQPGESADGLEDLNDHSLKPTSSKGFCQNASVDEEEGSMQHNYAEHKSCDTDEYHHLKLDVATLKDRFLTSSCTRSDDYMATAASKELNLCSKCNLDGQLLICSNSGCSLVVHENCLGSSPKYKSGNFYCPFCAYSLAMSELKEAMQKASLARKKLTSFISVEPPSKGCCERLFSNDVGSSRSNQKEGNQLIDNNGHLEVSPSIEGNAFAVDGHHSRNRKSNPQRVVPPRSCSDDNILGGLGPRPTATTSDKSVREEETERMIPEKEPVGRHEDRIQVDPKSNDNASSEVNRAPLVKERRAEKEACSELSGKQPGALPEKFASDTDDATDEHSRRSQSRANKCTYTYPAMPQMQRKKVPWTAEEEELLKEGVQKFSNARANMPWKMILDYGSSVFLKGRTPVHLKDKWRNMCKAEGRRNE